MSYPVNLVLDGRSVLVVGGGAVATRKAAGLVLAGAKVHVVAPLVTAQIKALDVTWEERPYRRGEVGAYRLVFTATDDAAVNRAVYEDGEAAGVWVNSADDPANCSFILPAVARQGPITVAVGTEGTSPALAAHLRRVIEGQLGPEWSALALILAEERQRLRSAGQPTEGLPWQNALESDMLDLIRDGRIDEARERLRACLSSSSD
jgi:precorrin-2 dehydrogenase/sirohydrochlorin ferrochelatase